ncbi:hypothetical protein Tsubulata_040378 [Turnera subulata]|uniref:DYW domain-containing protein n=1 Tax=Turnera subulata TaxID=218843 RepID=A0A9Q0FG65_9ROSI|nr:hypothetical protein Tsubulata_040378 [Turnera subulata]
MAPVIQNPSSSISPPSSSHLQPRPRPQPPLPPSTSTTTQPPQLPSLALSTPKPPHSPSPKPQNPKTLLTPDSNSLNATTTTPASSSPHPHPHRHHNLALYPPLTHPDVLYDFLSSLESGDDDLLKAVHAFVVKLLGNPSTFPWKYKAKMDARFNISLLLAYLKVGLPLHALAVLTAMPLPNVVAFTALISSFAKSRRESQAIEVFGWMRSQGIEPNPHTFVAILTACTRAFDLELGLQLHALAVKTGSLQCVLVANALMALYGKCGFLGPVIQVFDEMPHRDTVSWNTVLSCLVRHSSCENALELFRDLNQVDGFRRSQFTLSTVLTACRGCNAVMQGREVHAHAIRTGMESGLSVKNTLIAFYTKCGSIEDVVALFERTAEKDVITWTEMVTAYAEFGFLDLAVEIFEKMPQKNSVSYSALLAGFCKNGEGSKALDLFIDMLREGVELTDFTFTSIAKACGLLMSSETSRQIQGLIIKFGYGSSACVQAALLDMCARCGRMNDAEKMFLGWPSHWDSSIIQTLMICAYAKNGQPDEAILLFHRGLSEGIMIVDEVALTSVLGVCGTLGFSEMGKQIHCLGIKTGFLGDLGVGNSVTSMYCKCGSMEDAINSFNIMPAHDIVSWNGLIHGHLLHRQGDEALHLWSRMKMEGIKPDAITFLFIISAYMHTTLDLVHDCRSLFFSMGKTYGLEPSSEHYTAFAGVLGYWGLLEEAEEMILNMPFEPEASAWRALLDSCRLHKNSSMGKRVAKYILAMEPRDPSTYVLVTNLYSASGWWHCAETVRENMKKSGLRKHPCRSWIIHDEKVHSFYVRDKSHSQAKDIYRGLDILILECLKAGYEPDTSFVLHEVGEQQKKDFLFYHSAKLAATYGLLVTRPGKPIQIVKNIVLCGDCHTFLKYVSVVTRREIHVRDASGFHFISDGQCSCKDYWCKVYPALLQRSEDT